MNNDVSWRVMTCPFWFPMLLTLKISLLHGVSPNCQVVPVNLETSWNYFGQQPGDTDFTADGFGALCQKKNISGPTIVKQGTRVWWDMMGSFVQAEEVEGNSPHHREQRATSRCEAVLFGNVLWCQEGPLGEHLCRPGVCVPSYFSASLRGARWAEWSTVMSKNEPEFLSSQLGWLGRETAQLHRMRLGLRMLLGPLPKKGLFIFYFFELFGFLKRYRAVYKKIQKGTKTYKNMYSKAFRLRCVFLLLPPLSAVHNVMTCADTYELNALRGLRFIPIRLEGFERLYVRGSHNQSDDCILCSVARNDAFHGAARKQLGNLFPIAVHLP